MKAGFAIFIAITILGLVNNVRAQDAIDWDGKYLIQLSDFQASTTQIGGTNIYSIYSASSIDFSYHMSNAEFMFTKNFNSKVNCSFKRYAAALIAPDSARAMDLLEFARFEFDLAELYARKLRKSLYEKKGAFSDATFCQPIYEENQREQTERFQRAGKATDLGKNREILEQLHNEVMAELNLLNDFCKTCKPQKKK